MLKGAGHASDMIGRIKYNQTLKNRRLYFRPIRYYILKKKSRRQIIQAVQSRNLDQLRQSILIEKNKDQKRKIIISIMSILISLVILYILGLSIQFWYEQGFVNDVQ